MRQEVIQTVVQEIVHQLSSNPVYMKTIPIAVSARHCHLSEADLRTLFGKNYTLKIKKELSQPGQFAANETVLIAGPKGSIHHVRVLGPVRRSTQVEVSKTDAIRLGYEPPIRESGDIKGSSPITLVGPNGSIHLQEGLIIAKAHIHMHPDDAEAFSVRNGEYVKVLIENDDRPISFEKVLIRVSPHYKLEMHIDTDEANAGLITTGEKGKLIKYADLP